MPPRLPPNVLPGPKDLRELRAGIRPFIAPQNIWACTRNVAKAASDSCAAPKARAPDAHSDLYTNGYSYSYAHPDRNRHGHIHSDRNCYGHIHSDSYCHCHGYGDSNTNSNFYSDANANTRLRWGL